MVPPGTAAAGGSPPPSLRRNENHNGVLPHDADPAAAGPVRVDLRFEPSGRQVRVPAGVSVFDAASWNGIAIDSTCGGHGTCKKCKVRMLDGAAAPSALDIRAFSPGELREGWRLACRVLAGQDARIEVPPLVTRPKAATVGVGRQVILRPAVQKRYLELEEPSLADQRSDTERILAAVDDLELRVDLHAVRVAGRVLRAADFKVTAVIVDDVLIDVEPGDTSGRLFGIAFDLGTTTVVATVLDLSTGTPVAVASALNQQQPFGADVITRISATMMDPDTLARLTALAQQTLAELAGEACTEGGVDPAEVYEVALAGNATMTHIVLGIDPEPLGVAPFILAARLLPELLASDLGVPAHPRARAVVFPPFGAYVGGDITAGLLASGMDRDSRIRLFIDIGTNCEIVLGSRDWLLATAAPAGPAFEGAAIRCGMRAADGAIEVVTMTPDGLELKVIGDTDPPACAGRGWWTRSPGWSGWACSTPPAGWSARNGPRSWPRGWRGGSPSSAKSGCSSCTGWASPATCPGRCTCPSGMCASCSSPRRRSRPGGASCWRRPGCSRATSSRCCWPGRSAATCPPRTRSASAWCRTSRCFAW